MDLTKEFALDSDISYLNHAAVAPWPLRTSTAVEQFAHENSKSGAKHYHKWLMVEQRLRERLRILLNAPSRDDIALVKNTSEGLSIIAYGLDWQTGDEVVITDQEFPSNRIIWESLARFGVSVKVADISGTADPEQAIFAQVNDNTRLISVSSVQYGTGLRLDLLRIGSFCRSRGLLFCIDAIQSLGALQFDLQQNLAHFVAADGHKWLLGPEGLGLLYVDPEIRPQLKLHQFGWHMVEGAGDYTHTDWEIAHSARRFECGSPNMVGIHALEASLSLLEEFGYENIEIININNAKYLIEILDNISGISILSNRDVARLSPIVTFSHSERPPEEIFRHLSSNGVVCALRGGGVRFSPHFYTSQESIEHAVKLVDYLVNT